MVQQLKEQLENVQIKTDVVLKPVGLEVKNALELEFDILVKESDPRKLPVSVSLIKRNFMDFAIMVQLSHLMIATGVNEGQQYSQLSQAIGMRIANFYGTRIRENNAIQLGAFVLNAYAKLDLIIIKLIHRLDNKVQTVYNVYAGNKGKLQKLKKEFDEKSDPFKPLTHQAPDWEHGTIKTDIGEPIKLIKDSSVDTLSQINPNNTPIVLNAVNKKQKIAYRVKPELFEVYKWALKNDQNCFEHNSVETIEPARAIAKEAEAYSILEAAEPYVGKTFYQQYQADNRGRLYPLSAYLNELNSDNAKGMLSFANGMPLGRNGLNELLHHIVNMWAIDGSDKLTHSDKIEYANKKFGEFVSYGADPFNHKGWMDAEEPFQFLSAVMELAEISKWINDGKPAMDFVSHTICYRDGSNNGLQWLFSLAKDDVNAHLANVKQTPDGKPGDMYKHVANAVILYINEKSGEDQSVALGNYDKYFRTIERLRNVCRTYEAKASRTKSKFDEYLAEKRRKLVKDYQLKYKSELKTTDLLYWNKAEFTPSKWRKIVKRNVMTYGYSATKQGMGEQIIQDTRDIDDVYLSNKQHSAARLLGSLVYTTIETQFPKVSSTMKLFKDNCGLYMKQTGRQYGHTTMISNFPFVQHYMKQTNSRVVIKGCLYNIS